MKLLVICGYYDHATPFNGIEQTVNHMGLEPIGSQECELHLL